MADATGTAAPGASATAWDPARYGRFAAERSQPFHDLLALADAGRPVRPRGVDLGCGAGELTALAAERLHVTGMAGIDSSPEMLAAAAEHVRPGLRFVRGDLATWTSPGDHDLVLANASLQWVPDHPGVLARWAAALASGGELLVQVPANAGQPSHVVAGEVARSAAFADAFGPSGPPADPVAEHVLEPERYVEVLHDLGLEAIHVRLQVYPHVLASTRAIVDWVRGTTLTRFQRVLPADVFERFVAAYERRLVEVVGDRSPVLFPFRRILLAARRPG